MISARIVTRSGPALRQVHEVADVLDAHVDEQHVTIKRRQGDRIVFASRIVVSVEFLGGPL